MLDQYTRLKKAHVTLMKHPDTALYSGLLLMGESTVVDTKGVTAYTDGYNKHYGAEFLSTLTDAEVCALVLHENLHVALKHITRFKTEYLNGNKLLVGAALDYAVNDVIVSLGNDKLARLPKGGLYDPKFHGWGAVEIYEYLKKNAPKQNKPSPTSGEGEGKPQPSGGASQGEGEDSVSGEGEDEDTGSGGADDMKTLDKHDFKSAVDMDDETLEKRVDRALREGGMLAGRLGSKVPRCIEELLEEKVNWKNVLRDFITSATRGKDELSWRRFNKRLVSNDIYMPSLESETVGEIIVAIDTSGSIGMEDLSVFGTELYNICNNCQPEAVRVLWWDTHVHAEQRFTGESYGNLATLLKPVGGGGTRVSCVSEYLDKKQITVDAVLVFTDGHVESMIEWEITIPTLWLVNGNKSFRPPSGKVVQYD